MGCEDSPGVPEELEFLGLKYKKYHPLPWPEFWTFAEARRQDAFRVGIIKPRDRKEHVVSFLGDV